MCITPTYAAVETITAEEYIAADVLNISGFVKPPDDYRDNTNSSEESHTIYEVSRGFVETEQILFQTTHLDDILALGDILFKDGRDLTPEEEDIVEKYYKDKYEVID